MIVSLVLIQLVLVYKKKIFSVTRWESWKATLC